MSHIDARTRGAAKKVVFTLAGSTHDPDTSGLLRLGKRSRDRQEIQDELTKWKIVIAASRHGMKWSRHEVPSVEEIAAILSQCQRQSEAILLQSQRHSEAILLRSQRHSEAVAMELQRGRRQLAILAAAANA